MFGWLKKERPKFDPESRPKLDPESKWTIACDDKSIRVTDPKGVSKELRKADLAGVIIETNDTGPWGSDVWWLLFGADDQVAALFPQGATGESVLIDYLSTLPDFDFEAMISAMQSTDNNVFPVWRVKR